MTRAACPGVPAPPEKLNPAQERHLARAQAAFRVAAAAKYRAGVREHGGNLWEHSPAWLLEQVMEECIDQWMYAFTALEKLREGGDLAHQMVDGDHSGLGVTGR